MISFGRNTIGKFRLCKLVSSCREYDSETWEPNHLIIFSIMSYFIKDSLNVFKFLLQNEFINLGKIGGTARIMYVMLLKAGYLRYLSRQI